MYLHEMISLGVRVFRLRSWRAKHYVYIDSGVLKEPAYSATEDVPYVPLVEELVSDEWEEHPHPVRLPVRSWGERGVLREDHLPAVLENSETDTVHTTVGGKGRIARINWEKP